ncbi:MAG: hypothetical protein J6K96_05840 [Treponema sp.]|nr:hypothetical protein [Treponema sp.]
MNWSHSACVFARSVAVKRTGYGEIPISHTEGRTRRTKCDSSGKTSKTLRTGRFGKVLSVSAGA